MTYRPSSEKTFSLLGICWDEKSSFLRGAAKAPPLIREAINSPSANSYSELGTEIGSHLIDDFGDFVPANYFDIHQRISNIQQINHLLVLGGDHSISYPIIKAYFEKGLEFEILQIDAHGDLYDSFDGDRYSHACPFARIMEEDLCKRLTQIGVRTLTTHQRQQVTRYKVNCIEMKDFSSDKLHFDHPVYISLDLDALDPAFAPGVSHHEPGGLSTRQVLSIIQNIEVPIIGADIVEYNPIRDIHGMTAMVAAKLAKELWAKMLLNN